MLTPEETFFKIILFSDEVLYRNNLASVLRKERFTVELAKGGFHLLHLLESSSDWSMVIVHNDMKDMSGQESILLARNIWKKSELPILYLSEAAEPEHIMHFISIGATEYVIKNNNLQTVLDKARKYLSLSKNS